MYYILDILLTVEWWGSKGVRFSTWAGQGIGLCGLIHGMPTSEVNNPINSFLIIILFKKKQTKNLTLEKKPTL